MTMWPVLFMIPAVLVIQRGIHPRRVGLNPLLGLLTAWALVLCLYFVNPLNFDHVHTATWFLIVGALASFTVGYAAMVGPSLRGSHPLKTLRISPLTQGSAPYQRAHRLWLGATIWFAGFFLLFAKFLVTRFGLNPIHDLLPLREYLGSGQNAPIGFYYFYAAELLVPLGILMWDVVEPRRVRYLVVSAFAFGSLLLTSGRTNAITSILLTAVALLIRRGDTRIKPRVLLVTGGIFVLGLGIIIGIGNIEGKTFANSSILTYVTSTTWLPPQLTLPYVEFVGPIPALDQVVLGKPPLLSSTPLPDTHNQTFRPLYQLASIVDRNVKVPSNIQPFRSIPEPFNVYTALGPLWLDLGPIGTMFFMFGFGLICGKAYALWLRTPSLATLLLVALATTVAIVSVGDLRLDDLSVWVQGGALLILFLSDRSAKKPARRPSHLYGTRMTPADHLTGYVKQPLT